MAFDLTAVIRLQDRASGPIKKVEASMQQMNRAADASNASIARMERAGRLAGGTLRAMGNAGSSIISSFTGIKAAVTGAAGAFALWKTSESALKLASDAEQASIAFETMLGSAEKSQRFLADLTKFANNSPFQLPGLRDSAKKMLAFGFAASDVIPTLSAIGNASAGLGLGADGIDRITLAFGQLKAKGRVQGDELLQFAEAGLPVLDILAKKMQITTGEVLKLSEKGLIPADAAIKTLVEGLGQRFPDMMTKQSKSLAGLWSTMKDTFDNNIVKKWGDGLSNTLRPRFLALTTWINANGETIDRWGLRLQNVAAAASDAIARKFEGAFKYVKSHYFDNPEFTKIPDISGRVEYVIADMQATFSRWYSSGGNKQIENVANNVSSFLASSLGAVAEPLVAAGVRIGKSLGSGIVSGVSDTIKDHPLLASIAAAAATPGDLRVKALAGASVFAVSEYQNIKQGFTDPKKAERAQVEKDMKKFYTPDFVDALQKNYPGWQPPDYVTSGAPKHAGGLSSVPYNGYVSELHKDEMVLTKSQADDYRSGNGGGRAIVIHKFADTINVRNDADIHAIARELAFEINGAAMAGG